MNRVGDRGHSPFPAMSRARREIHSIGQPHSLLAKAYGVIGQSAGSMICSSFAA